MITNGMKFFKLNEIDNQWIFRSRECNGNFILIKVNAVNPEDFDENDRFNLVVEYCDCDPARTNHGEPIVLLEATNIGRYDNNYDTTPCGTILTQTRYILEKKYLDIKNNIEMIGLDALCWENFGARYLIRNLWTPSNLPSSTKELLPLRYNTIELDIKYKIKDWLFDTTTETGC